MLLLLNRYQHNRKYVWGDTCPALPSLHYVTVQDSCHATYFAISGPGCVSKKHAFTKTFSRHHQTDIPGRWQEKTSLTCSRHHFIMNMHFVSKCLKKRRGKKSLHTVSITYLSSWGVLRGQTQPCQRLKLVGKSRQSWVTVSASSSSSSSPALPLSPESQVRLKLGSHGEIQKQGAASPRRSGGWLNLWQHLEPHVCFSCRCPARVQSWTPSEREQKPDV